MKNIWDNTVKQSCCIKFLKGFHAISNHTYVSNMKKKFNYPSCTFMGQKYFQVGPKILASKAKKTFFYTIKKTNKFWCHGYIPVYCA